MKKASVIVRTKNEERWIGQCLSSIRKQAYKNFEIILVDNDSSDKTVEIASTFDIKLVKYSPEGKFKPGKAINLGIEASSGEYIVIISGHCIPTNENWLEKLIANLSKEKIAGVYGRQQPLSFTSNLDKRDLAITFGLDKKIQIKDPFFHNANSALSRNIWEKFPFDEECTNIEDRIWGKRIISSGYQISYEPEASVYHHHGIHHGLNEERADKIIGIMESINEKISKEVNFEDIKIAAFIPIKGELINYKNQFLLNNTLNVIKNNKKIKDIVISTDNDFTAKVAKDLGATKIITRPDYLSNNYVGVADVIKFTLEEYERLYGKLDIVLFLEETYPFRDKNEIDHMINTLLKEGKDSLIAVSNEKKGAWIKNETKVTPIIEQNFMPRKLKSQTINIAQVGYCTLLKTEFISFGDIMGPNILLYNIDKKLSTIEVKDNNDMKEYLNLLN